MKRLAALLIVLTFTGSPVAHAACLTWCASDTAVSRSICHHTVANAMPVAMMGESATCTAFVAADAFFTLERRAIIHPPAAMVRPPEHNAFVNVSLTLPTRAATAAARYVADPVQVLRL